MVLIVLRMTLGDPIHVVLREVLRRTLAIMKLAMPTQRGVICHAQVQ